MNYCCLNLHYPCTGHSGSPCCALAIGYVPRQGSDSRQSFEMISEGQMVPKEVTLIKMRPALSEVTDASLAAGLRIGRLQAPFKAPY